MMQDSVYTLAQRSLNDFIDHFERIIPVTTKVINSIEIENV